MLEVPCHNRLSQETSPYLLQHARNPVDWYPWGEVALARARREDRPILLSIGYSACHWCHAMAHESFEDAATAELMNALFVNIKVDREERPDLDKIYQTAHQLLTRRPGGWPLTVFLSPQDHMPIFSGTYFPREPRHGLPAFKDLLQRIAGFYREHKDQLQHQSASFGEAFRHMEQASAGNLPGPELLRRARDELEKIFDERYGGFGQAPKFFHPTSLERLLRHWADSVNRGTPDDRALYMVRHSLRAMAAGGIHDQLGGGFYRYSVDEQWMIPHFEKMLYDNGQLLALYADAALATGERDFIRVAGRTGDWVMREMQAPEGGYYATLDADSEGGEGRFYVWDTEELQAALDTEQWLAMRARYGLEDKPNFEGRWHLHARREPAAVAEMLRLPEDKVTALIAGAQETLFALREQRVRPGRDEKILGAWNGLMIKGMARAGRVLGRPDFVDSAQRAADFIHERLWRGGRLLATAKDGRARLNAYLDDYVFLMDGLLELLQARWRGADLAWLTALAEALLDHFEDKTHGGFFFTSDDHEPLVHRPRPESDDATPSGNGVAAGVLQRLGHLLGEARYLEAAEATLRVLHDPMRRYLPGHGSALQALEEILEPPQIIVLRGAPEDMNPWQARCLRAYAPRRLVFAIPEHTPDLPPALAGRRPRGEVTAYICRGHRCSAPLATLEELERGLKE